MPWPLFAEKIRLTRWNSLRVNMLFWLISQINWMFATRARFSILLISFIQVFEKADLLFFWFPCYWQEIRDNCPYLQICSGWYLVAVTRKPHKNFTSFSTWRRIDVPYFNLSEIRWIPSYISCIFFECRLWSQRQHHL